jgi:cytochrome c biogenesis protein CcmG/thiol:disulfide interchange protein DsbE
MRMRTAVPRCWSLACLLVCVCFAAGTARAAESLLHKNAPEFVLADLNGNKVDLHAYRGKVVLLDFWATWCAPCQLEMPRFVAWQKQYGPRGLRVIGISMDDDPELARKLCKKLRLNYPVMMGDEKIGELYGGVLGLPVTFLIDSHGVVRAKFQGETDMNAMEEQLKALLLQP